MRQVVADGEVRPSCGSRGGGVLGHYCFLGWSAGHLPCGGLGRGDKGEQGRGLDPTWIKRRLAAGELEVGHAAARGRLEWSGAENKRGGRRLRLVGWIGRGSRGRSDWRSGGGAVGSMGQGT